MTTGWAESFQSMCFLAVTGIFCAWLTRLGNEISGLTNRVIDLEQERNSGRGRR